MKGPSYKQRVKAVRETLLKAAEEYKAPGIDDRYEAKLQTLMQIAKEMPEDFDNAAKAIINGFQMHLLALWSQKKIEGPPTRANYEKKIKQTESLIKMLEKKGKEENLEKARKRLVDLKAEYQKAEESGLLRA